MALAPAVLCLVAAAGAAAPVRYGDEAPVEATALEKAVLRAATERLPGPPPAVSPALVRAARELAEGAARGDAEPLGRARLRAALAHAAAFDPAPLSILVQSTLAEKAPGAVAQALSPQAATHLGAGVARRGDSYYTVLLLSRRLAAIEGFPRDVSPGASVLFTGRLVALDHPQIAVTLPSGEVREWAAKSLSGRFIADVPFGDPGRYLVEVTGTGAEGPQVGALLVISCGGAALEEASRPLAREPADIAGTEALVVQAVNDLRRRRGLPGLEATDALTYVARAHSAQMLDRGTLGHTLPGSRDVGERLRRAGISYQRADENVAKGTSALAAHEAAAESPAHLANLLDPAVSRIGCGVARGRLASGDAVVYLTEVFVRPADVDRSTAIPPDLEVARAVLSARAAAGAAALARDPALDDLARLGAAAMASADDPGPGDVTARVLRLGRGLATVDTTVCDAPEEALRPERARDPRLRRFGVGVILAPSARARGAVRRYVAVVYSD